ncbi:hypothetical protein SCHPADRAFT_251218 [Schizopora paradoxa]|uniref:Uncharacterized protein n=1 Tax=Schizopora paradoxa TaxID=27342 RepID=A0A0H2RVN3_9AGAM|nr:hypothetical protein SCHPADRAFT_251218 [Schizopora paradoxa]
MATKLRTAYRSLVREARKLNSPRVDAKNDISRHFRAAVESQKQGQDGRYDELVRDVSNAALFLKSQRAYNELLERYNPLHGMSQEERTVATARRVGLDMPIEKKHGDSEEK